MACDGKQEKDTVAMAAKTFFSLKNSMSEISRGKKMLTALAEKIKFKYKFLLFYQGLFVFFSVFFFCFNVQRFVTTDLLVNFFFPCFQQVTQRAKSSL